MGRKTNFAEVTRKGSGRRARKQQDPIFDTKLSKGGNNEDLRKLSHRQKIRAKKREQHMIEKNKFKAEKRETKLHKESVTKSKPQCISDDEEEENVLNQHLVSIDLKRSREKYAKTASKFQNSVIGSELEEEKLSTEEIDNEKGIKRCRDILASDTDSDDEMESQAKDDNMEDFLNFEGEEYDSGKIKETDDDEHDESILPIEKVGKKLRKRLEEEKHLADEELQHAAANKETFQFPEDGHITAVNLQDINLQIKEIVGVLADFAVNRDPNRSRSEYMDLLCKELCVYYSYNEFLMQLLMKLFSPNELLEFLEASEVQRPLTIRTNSLKTRRRDLAQTLINRGVNLDPIGKWSKEGLVVYTSQVPLGATPEYLGGHYMIQGASSLLPVIALAPEENERILDLCAAPGGKSSHIAALMKNTGVLFANDLNKDRLQAVVGNFHRLGIQNAIVTSIDGTKYRDVMTGFDRVLLDAPCSGSGVISKDPSVKTTKSDVDIQRCYNLQRKLLLTAIDCLSANTETGGFLVYSTCSILPQENEWVVNYALRKRNVRLVSTGLDFGSEGFVNFAGQKYHPSMRLTRRFYPHKYNMDGFFIAKLQKFSDAFPNVKKEDSDEEENVDDQELPEKVDKRDWYYNEVLAKRKKRREDANHVVKVFEKAKNKKQKNPENGTAIPVEVIKSMSSSGLQSSTKEANLSEKKSKKQRLSMQQSIASNGAEIQQTPKVKNRLPLRGSSIRKRKK